jgi:uncharacterized membrane protein
LTKITDKFCLKYICIIAGAHLYIKNDFVYPSTTGWKIIRPSSPVEERNHVAGEAEGVHLQHHLAGEQAHEEQIRVLLQTVSLANNPPIGETENNKYLKRKGAHRMITTEKIPRRLDPRLETRR